MDLFVKIRAIGTYADNLTNYKSLRKQIKKCTNDSYTSGMNQ